MTLTYTRTRAAVLAVIAAALVAVALLGHGHPAATDRDPAPAAAAPAAPLAADHDAAFVQQLAAVGMIDGDPATLIGQAHLICEGMAAAVPTRVMQATIATWHPAWNGDQARYLIDTARALFCTPSAL